MQFATYVRKPFLVEATEVTEENLAEVAELIGLGGKVRTEEDGTRYISVDRRLVPNINRVYVGFWVTKMGDNYRCYSQRVFKKQFVENEESIEKWVNFINGAPIPYVPQ